jgi:hypothetical protein
MNALLDYPIAVFAISLAAMAVGAQVGAVLARRGIVGVGEHEYFGVIQTATLTLLGWSSASRSRWP